MHLYEYDTFAIHIRKWAAAFLVSAPGGGALPAATLSSTGSVRSASDIFGDVP